MRAFALLVQLALPWAAHAQAAKEASTPVPSVTAVPTSPTLAPTAAPTKRKLVNTAVELDEIETTLEINCALLVLMLLLFEVKRGKYKRVYSPRELYYSRDADLRAAKLPGRPEPTGWFGWLTFATAIPDDEMRRMVGLDGFLLLRFCRGLKRVFFWASFFGLVVLVPIYATGRQNRQGFDKLTMGNLLKPKMYEQQPRLWAPVAFIYALTFLVLRFLETEATNYLKWRRDYLSFYGAASPDEYQSRCSVLVERLPPPLRSDSALKEFFGKLVGEDKVHSAVVFLDLRDLEKKLDARNRAVAALKDVILAGKDSIRIWRCLRWCGLSDEGICSRTKLRLGPFRLKKTWCYVVVDADEYAAAKLRALDEAFTESRDRALADEVRTDRTTGGALFLFGLSRRQEGTENDDGAETNKKRKDHFFDHSPFEWFVPSSSFQKTTSSSESLTTTPFTTTTQQQQRQKSPSNTPLLLYGDDEEKSTGGSSFDLENKGRLQGELPSESNGNVENRATKFVKGVAQTALQATTSATQNVLRQAGDLTETTIGGLATTLALDEILQNPQTYMRSSTGVVTFSNPGTASDATQVALTSEPEGIEAKAVPTPGNMVWQNVGTSAAAYETRSTVADVAYWGVALVWTSIQGLIVAISNLEEMENIFPFLKPFVREDKYAYPRSLVSGYLPVLLYLAMLALVPIFLEYVAERYVGLQSKTAIQRYVLSRHFYFQLVAVLVACLSGSITVTLKNFLKDPASLLTVLGKNIPIISAYFFQTILVKALFSLSFELSRPLHYFLSSAKGKIDKYVIQNKRRRNSSPFTTTTTTTTRTAATVGGASGGATSGVVAAEEKVLSAASAAAALAAAASEDSSTTTEETTSPPPRSVVQEILDDSEKPEPPPEFRIGYTGPEFLMVVLVGLTYAPIAPVILVVACGFFALAEAVLARQFLFVYANASESGGLNVFPPLNFFTHLSILVAQAVLFSYLLLNRGVFQAPVLLPLPFGTVYFYLRLVRFYENPAKFLDRDTAVTHDLYKTNPATPLRPDAYRHPALVAPSVDADLLVARLNDIVGAAAQGGGAHEEGGTTSSEHKLADGVV